MDSSVTEHDEPEGEFVDLYDCGESAEITRICVQCGHLLAVKGEPNTSEYWQCEKNCQCLMVGCVPKDAKYGTDS